MRKLILLGAVLALPAAIAHPYTADQVMARHVQAMNTQNWPLALSDVAPEAVFVLNAQTILDGAPAVRAYFNQIPTKGFHFTASAEPAKGDVAIENWVMNPGTPQAVKGQDVFVIRGGKIRYQTTISVVPAPGAK